MLKSCLWLYSTMGEKQHHCAAKDNEVQGLFWSIGYRLGQNSPILILGLVKDPLEVWYRCRRFKSLKSLKLSSPGKLLHAVPPATNLRRMCPALTHSHTRTHTLTHSRCIHNSCQPASQGTSWKDLLSLNDWKRIYKGKDMILFDCPGDKDRSTATFQKKHLTSRCHSELLGFCYLTVVSKLPQCVCMQWDGDVWMNLSVKHCGPSITVDSCTGLGSWISNSRCFISHA